VYSLFCLHSFFQEKKSCGCSVEERGSDSSFEVCAIVFIFEASTTQEPPVKITEYYPNGKWSWTSVPPRMC